MSQLKVANGWLFVQYSYESSCFAGKLPCNALGGSKALKVLLVFRGISRPGPRDHKEWFIEVPMAVHLRNWCENGL